MFPALLAGPASAEVRARLPLLSMKPRFQPYSSDTEHAASGLVEAERCDASQARFAASLEKQSEPRFVVEQEVAPRDSTSSTSAPQLHDRIADADDDAVGERPEPSRGEPVPESTALTNDNSWRGEVAARVNRYRARRRPRGPRYPSLQLKFEIPEPSLRPAPESRFFTIGSQLAVAVQDSTPPIADSSSGQEVAQLEVDTNPSDTSARILEFPRSAPPPVDELAEPILDRPRILEVPEQQPAPPALGGILIEPEEQAPRERRPGFELPLEAAPMSRRVTAAIIDALIVAAAFSLFAFVFFRVNSVVPPLSRALPTSAIMLGLIWAGYQYLLLVYAGSTPGLKIAKLELNRFDGRGVPRRIRRWRVLASILSGMSLALGYAWCFLDEDQLCWHDRITRTYMAPKAN
jgi:uncharacterized RDD family membrane protein YckC